MNVKNRSDLSEFPDGGRATLVRRYSPTLTRRELTVLLDCPYDRAGYISAAEPSRRTALALVTYGLLERNPDSPNLFRVTAAGVEVVQHWQTAGWRV